MKNVPNFPLWGLLQNVQEIYLQGKKTPVRSIGADPFMSLSAQ